MGKYLRYCKKIPRKDVDGDAVDAPSVTTEIEQLFLKLLHISDVGETLPNDFAVAEIINEYLEEKHAQAPILESYRMALQDGAMILRDYLAK